MRRPLQHSYGDIGARRPMSARQLDFIVISDRQRAPLMWGRLACGNSARMLTVYQYPKCSTCRNALRWLDDHGLEYEKVDITQAPPGPKLLADILERSGLPLAKLFNTSGQSYRDGNFKKRLETLSRAEALKELAQDGKLIKRPLVVSQQVALVGFDAERYQRELGRAK